mgnify:CR=1 FL=1
MIRRTLILLIRKVGLLCQQKMITLPTHFIDLHLHLDGVITLDIAKVLAKLQNQTLPSSSDAELSKLLSIPPDCEDLNEYLRRFDLPISLLQTKESISEAFYLVQEKLIAPKCHLCRASICPSILYAKRLKSA